MARKPELVPDDGMPTSFIVCTVMWIIHGFILDIVVIGILPFISEKASDAQRTEKFPWALGGYKGFHSKVPVVRGTVAALSGVQGTVPNLDPAHRRFIAENAACE